MNYCRVTFLCCNSWCLSYCYCKECSLKKAHNNFFSKHYWHHCPVLSHKDDLLSKTCISHSDRVFPQPFLSTLLAHLSALSHVCYDLQLEQVCFSKCCKYPIRRPYLLLFSPCFKTQLFQDFKKRKEGRRYLCIIIFIKRN